MKKIGEIIDTVKDDIDILGITDDSRLVKNGYLFVATKGFNVDHFNYIEQAIKKGAVFIVSDRKISEKIPHYIVNKDVDINEFYIKCCQKFYDINPKEFNIIGITGTDGKTTTASIISQILDDYAYIGTNGVTVNDLKYETTNTTPCVSELYNYLSIIKKNNIKNIVMEVSSEALLHERLKDFELSMAAITNITEDHLNIHKNINNYRECKFKIVKLLQDKALVIINGDDSNCKLLKYKNIITFGFKKDNDFVIKNVVEKKNYVSFEIENGTSIYKLKSPFLGKYNIYNVTLAFIICLKYNYNLDEIIRKIRQLKVIEGRREYLNFGQPFDIILDYAHTYNGIKNILESVSHYKKIIVVTGQAGGREKEKRPLIGKLILDKANIAIFTMDDPRFEDVNDIIDEMVGLDKRSYLRIVEREKAIEKAFSLADRNSVVLILGKGRDNYMAICDKKIYYSDYDTIKKILKK